MERREFLVRLRILLTRFREIARVDAYLWRESDDLEGELNAIETQLAKMIDDYMSSEFKKANDARDYIERQKRWS